MVTRRQVLKYGALSTCGVYLWSKTGGKSLAQAPNLLDPFTVPQFVNPLPGSNLELRKDITSGGQGQINVRMGQTSQDLLGRGILTKVWGYGLSNKPITYPGPTFVARSQTPVEIKWENTLSGQHLLPVDTTLHWADPEEGGVPTVTHLHGGHTESASDGLPEAWFTPNFSEKGEYWRKETYRYDNDQEAGTLWYHDHALGLTRLNVYAGLAGFYLLRDDYEYELIQSDQLPHGYHEIELVIQDRLFTADSQLYYPADFEPEEIRDEFPGGPSVLPEFFGNVILVNGKAWPVLEVDARKYRFRLLNGSDSRFYNLWINSGSGGDLNPSEGNGPQIIQIGTDNGFLDQPVALDQLTIGPGERADLVVDFTDWKGETLVMRNNARIPFPKGDTVDPLLDGRIMAFRVSDYSPKEDIKLPNTLRPFAVEGSAKKTRKLILFEGIDRFGRLQPLLGTVEDGTLLWDDPITENPGDGDVEIWEIYNATEDAHPIHLHLVSFEVLNRQGFKADLVPKDNPDPNHEGDTPTLGGRLQNIKLKGQPRPSLANERGPKDTVQMFPGEVTRIKAKFDRSGRYVWHCHILSHEDHEMMRPYQVGPLENG